MGLPVPALDVNADLVPFALVAAPMVVVTVLVLGLVRPRDGRSPLVTQLLLAVTVVAGGSLLLLALLFVFIDTNGTSAWTWVLMAFNFMMVVPVGLWFVGHIVYEDRRVPDGGWLWPVGLGIAVTGSEALMGLLFAVGGASGAISIAVALARGLSSVWFFWSMAGVMAPLVLWAPLTPVGRAAGWALVAAAVIGPWVRPYPLVGGLAMAVLMGLALAAILRPLFSGSAAGADGRLLLAFAAAFFGMTAAGLGVAATAGSIASVVGFGVLMAVVMVGEVSYLLHRSYTSPAALGPTSPAPLALRPVDGSGFPGGPVGGP